jgi:2-amino-4-hydroxy-6-hydroxymethyldihydropteridine diphosphokinase
MRMSSPQSITAYIAIGANLGEREKTMRRALAMLDETDGVRVARVSSFIENPAVGGPADSPAFLNGVAEVQTTFSPEALLDRLLEIEQQLGRVRREKWEPRAIDLDVILFGDQIVNTDRLTIPHPLMHERQFVLEPLAEIAPEVVHPILNENAAQLWAQLRRRLAVSQTKPS